MTEDRIEFHCRRCLATVSVEREDVWGELWGLGWGIEYYILCPHCKNELQRFMNGEAIEGIEMINQEKIREGLARTLFEADWEGLSEWEDDGEEMRNIYYYDADVALRYLHSQGLKLSNGESLIEVK